MLRLSLILALTFSLVLPYFGSTASARPTEPCPMQSSLPHQDHTSPLQAPCCEHMEDAVDSLSKSPCKPGQECKTSGLLQAVEIKAAPLQHPVPGTPLAQPPIQREPTPLWRPPCVA
ncbi:hypothetical protein SAMN05216221_4269 [Pseudomonas oryzae]|uniref:Uncharacterized protein n=1 Tax=Pseudomonas oryzae TaxID=1392877 RepID=A0A1H1ZI96_9PSED|nr:hypothetical protein SAMN05216221_4269 [Pseudomonas oryzae]